MATKKTVYEAPAPASDKKKALQTALAQIDKAYGKGSFDDYVEKAVAGAVDKLASTDVGKR